MKKRENFCYTGKDVYEGVKLILSDIFNSDIYLTREEIVNILKELIERFDYNIYIYKTWENSYDFIRFLVKMSILKYENQKFSLTEKSKDFRRILMISELDFRKQLFKHVYEKSLTEATRFREFCDFIKIESSGKGFINYKKFQFAKENLLKSKQRTNYGAIDFLKDVGLIEINLKTNIVRISLELFSLIDKNNIALKILKENSISKQIEVEKARELLRSYGLDPDIIKDLEIKQEIIIRSTRSGKFIDFN